MQITNISNFNIAQSVKVTVDTMSFTVIITVKYTAFLLIFTRKLCFHANITDEYNVFALNITVEYQCLRGLYNANPILDYRPKNPAFHVKSALNTSP